MLILAGLIISSCNGKVDKTTSNTPPPVIKKGIAAGTYNASGTITFTIGGENYSCPISKVISAPTTLTIQTSSTDVKNTGSITITCYTASKAVVTGTYSASTPEALASVSFVNKKFSPYSATSGSKGSSCKVIINTLTSNSIKGTFTATVSPALSGPSLSITNGSFDCTIK